MVIKLFLRKILIATLQPLGFYITYYASADRVYESLSKLDVLIQQYELKRIFDSIGIAKNHKFYNGLLANFIPSWNLQIKNAKFVESGAGESSLSTFRKITVGDKIFHEKIYFSSHPDLKRISWFYGDVSQLVHSSGVELPTLYNIYEGRVITAIYTNYFELKNLDLTEKEKSLVRFSKQLYRMSISKEFEIINKEVSNDIKRFKDHFEYNKSRPVANVILGKHGLSLEAIEQIIMESRHVLTHGDIQDTNAFKNNVLIDWDSVGIYPAGLDPAFLLYQLILKSKSKEIINVLKWIDVHYKNLIKDNEWNSFHLNIIFFLFVFIQRRIKKEKYKILNRELISQLKRLNLP